jgi:glycosyltransferase involved in cell wall biosynthesis
MEFKEDPKFSAIVPVYDVPPDVFKRCLMSLADQDYPNLEVIIVPNGGDKDAEKMAREFAQGRENWKILPTEEKGACQARNHGFKASSGAIVAFVNSDYILNPGCIRTWVDELEKHPDCGFVYGAYEYTSANRDVYWSKDFDPELLEVSNYIDCGFPVRAKHISDPLLHALPWDSEVKSLQDWDFWLRIVKRGVKGHYLGRYISYLAAPPRPKGLSHDSTDNWKERVRFIKNKHGIPIRDICVASIGAPNHGVEIAKMIGADYRDDTLHKPHDYKALYLIGWYMKPGEENGHARIVNMFPKSKKIIHWVGADIYWLRSFSVKAIREFAGALKLTGAHMLCENELAQKELESYGIEAEIVPIPTYSTFDVLPLPKEFSVALYLTDRSDFDKYLQAHTLSLVKAMPDAKFYGYGDSSLIINEQGEKFNAKNFEHKGSLTRPEWEKFVGECSAYVRLVRHDTRPLATDEFLMAGRSVITNIPNPFCNYIDTSGKEPFDQWDTFAPGFSPARWPATKKSIVQTIRKVKRFQAEKPNAADQRSEFDASRRVFASSIKLELDRENYIRKIRSLALTPELAVVS